MKKAVIVIPTYNERSNIIKLVPHIFKVVENITRWHISILVVDDNSPDGTGDAVEEMKSAYPNLHVIHGRKRGLGMAYIRGFEHAIEKLSPDILFEMDADGQHDPNLIPDFIREIDNGADFVIGSRYIKGGSIPKEWAIHRKFLSYFGNNLVLRFGFMEFSVTDWTSGYRAIRVPFIQQTIEHYRRLDGYTFQIGIVDQALKNKLKITEIPLNFKDRKVGESKIQTFTFIRENLLYIFNNSSFLKFFIVGLSGAIVDFSMAAFLIHTFLMFKPHANAISAETAIIFNFMLNNFWSFKHKQIEKVASAYLKKFLEFNLVSSGSIFLQWAGMLLALKYIGDFDVNLTLVNVPVWVLYKILIILLLIIPYSYFMYNRFVWKD